MKKHLFFITVLLTLSLAIATLPYFFSDGSPVWKDPIALACAVKHIDQNQELGLGNNFYINYDAPQISYCWDSSIYPLNQIYQFAVKTFSGLNPTFTVSLVYLFIYLLITLALYLLAWEIYQKQHLSFLAAFLGATSLALLRITTIIPQQLFGFLLLIVIAWLLLRYEKTRQKKFLLLIILALLNLVWLHHLTLSVLIVGLSIYFLSRFKNKKLIIPAVVLALVLIILTASFLAEDRNSFNYIINLIYSAATFGMVDLLAAHPVWDHPTILGYALTILGIFGMIYSLFIKKFPLKVFWWVIVIFGLFMAHSYIFGFYFFGYRFLFFLFIPLSIFTPLFLVYLEKVLPKISKFLFPIIILFIVISSNIHGLNFVLDDYYGKSKTVLPPKELKQAISWLNENSESGDTILTTSRNDQKYASYLPYLYHGNVMIYPVFFFNTLSSFEFKSKTAQYLYSDGNPSPQTKLAKLLKPYYLKTQKNQETSLSLANKEKNELYDMYQMINFPGKREVKKIMVKYQVNYILTWRNQKEDRIFASKKGGFDKVYENDLLEIYKRKKFI